MNQRKLPNLRERVGDVYRDCAMNREGAVHAQRRRGRISKPVHVKIQRSPRRTAERHISNIVLPASRLDHHTKTCTVSDSIITRGARTGAGNQFAGIDDIGAGVAVRTDESQFASSVFSQATAAIIRKHLARNDVETLRIDDHTPGPDLSEREIVQEVGVVGAGLENASIKIDGGEAAHVPGSQFGCLQVAAVQIESALKTAGCL